MPYPIGFVLGPTAGGYATAMRLDRACYPTVSIVVASSYVLFAVAASVGFRRSL